MHAKLGNNRENLMLSNLERGAESNVVKLKE